MSGAITDFVGLFDMAAHGPDVWVGPSARYPWGRVYGGQVAAQGLWVAAQTVPEDYAPHSLHAYFIRGGDFDEPIRFEVDRIRDGRSFVTRRVVARQSSGAILNLSASFQLQEDAADATAISVPAPVPPVDELNDDSWSPLLERRPVPRDEERARAWIRVPGPLPDDPLIHVLAHVFASDDMATEAVELEHPSGRPDWHNDDGSWDAHDHPYMGASLDHTVWFHRWARGDEWCLHDMRSSGVYGARGLSFGDIWSADGLHIASMAQEVLLREVDRKG
ncbi:MAG: thioesterase family protein [Acidimicrobiales bacterium]|nr:thioesterase family protein [Acidimicrobiales bacterium]